MKLHTDSRGYQQNPMKTISDITNMTNRLNTDGSMDKVRKLLQSPGSRRKIIPNARKTFGVPLDELVQQAPTGSTVPFLVTRLCEHIQSKGFDHEGIFRINGSARIVEKLRASFDTHGNADLEEDNDIMAIAGLLKLFLREFPDPVIPSSLTKQFVSIQEACMNDTSACIYKLKMAVINLPKDNYNLLKYLTSFLVVVASHERQNKMSPMALAIVFGPNLFKCGMGVVGLKDQGTVNQIVYKFIFHYNAIFKLEHENSPEEFWLQRRKQKTPPPRPPPPKLQVVDVEARPVATPRKSKLDYDSTQYQDNDDWDHSEGSSSTNLRPVSPRFSDDELVAGRASPFILDSDGGYSMIESPIPSARTSETVEKVITQTITDTLFGDEDRSFVRDSLEFQREANTEEDTATDTSIGQTGGVGMDTQEDSSGNSRMDDDVVPAVRDRIKQFEDRPSEGSATTKVGKQRPSSSAFSFFEGKGIIITQQKPNYTGNEEAGDGKENSDTAMRGTQDKEDDFETVSRRNSGTLSSFKRPAGPANRRSPTRKHRASLEEVNFDEDVDQLLQDTGAKMVIETIPDNSTQNAAAYTQEAALINGGIPKPRVAFLELAATEIRRNGGSPNRSPNDSPSSSRKPFIPPLDLSTLHQHVDSSDAILANKAQSVSYLRADSQLNGDDIIDTQAVISPRSGKLNKRKSDIANTDIPPSPPVGQDQYKKHSTGSADDEYTVKLRMYTKKIQGLKKKIRHYEETFERDNGFKPSHVDKTNKPEVKRWMGDITKAKKEIKKLKEEAEMGSRSRHGSGTSSSGERGEPPDLPPTMEQTLLVILQKLEEKRKDIRRPEDVNIMSREQVQDEKLSVQKALLHFESIHGRPRTKDDKDLMRPLYDRYRTIKRLLIKPSSPRDKGELQTVPEDQPFELDPADARSSKFINPVHVPTADNDEDEEGGGLEVLGTMDFAVTRDFSILRDPLRPTNNANEKRNGHSPKVKRKLDLSDEDIISKSAESNLHEMSVPELQDELLWSRGEKKRLRRLLRNFEEEFLKKNDRKVQREDRIPLQSEYQGYKQTKARLKLLEALISKYQQSSDA
ncbi:protein FAM13B-like isoform X3 [Mizuhopecten yessoensis]|uniref:protein FAM13B-like isoform X3 n=1 Tax=Mizuhopecten yessoensis TaxID=6573 RepID=UPI000B4582F7|nr:protein FAM13B-like isoform X3 [Mizuhopecten yessoensis]